MLEEKLKRGATTSWKTERYLEMARKEAASGVFHMRHGAVLVKGGSIINKSCNSPNFSLFMKRFCFKKAPIKRNSMATRHAELMCVLGLDKSKTNGATICVVRINNQGKFMMSRPCELCMEVMKFTGIRNVIYSINEDEYGRINLRG